MIDEKEKAYYRSNITDKYVIEIATILEVEERIQKRKYEQTQQFEKFKINNPDYKKCNKCGEYKRLSEFYKNPLKKQGVFDYCKKCAKEMKNKKKVDLGFWNQEGEYIEDIQEVDFEKE